MPLQDVAGHIQVEKLDLFLDGLGGEPVVHCRDVGRGRHQRLVFGLDAGVAGGIDAEHVGSLSEGGNRILGFPVRQGAPARILGDQVDQVGGSRTRHAHHDQRPLDGGDCFDFGIPLQQIGQ